jgi:glutamyl-tRNA synthetase
MRGRFAPSPTGDLHLGNARTALFSWLDVRAAGGTFVMRMEDLDPERCSPGSARGILEDLRWLGLDWDEGPDVGGPHGAYDQSARTKIYEAAVAELVGAGRGFPCACSRKDVARAAGAPHAGEEGPRYPGTCHDGPSRTDRPHSIRLRVPDGTVTFADRVAGPQAVDVSRTAGDFVIRRADGVAAYQLATALDDAVMGMTRVLRGDDLLSSTARQILLMDLLGHAHPEYAHVPLLVGEDGHRLAKRGGALTLRALRARGVRPEAVVGLLARTAGLAGGGPVRPGDLIPRWDLRALARSPAVITERDLDALR